ncbi:MAG: hypothetical protein NVSMB27_21690 [Ktedonobacteraceae bacterium]
MRRWAVDITQGAQKQMATIYDRRVQDGIRKRINQLEYEPEKQGKPLKDELTGYRSVRAVGQRYRILYKVETEKVIVLVVALGIRKDGDKKDVYEQATFFLLHMPFRLTSFEPLRLSLPGIVAS